MISMVFPDMAVCDVAGFLRLAVGHVLGRADDADDADLRLEQRNGAHGADHRCTAGHVVLHLLHVVGGLDGDAAGVEGDALADEAENRSIGHAFGFVLRTISAGGSADPCETLQNAPIFSSWSLSVEWTSHFKSGFGGHLRGALAEDRSE